MKKQALTVTIVELQDLIVGLSREIADLDLLTNEGYGKIRFQVNIVNPTPKFSDTWRLEDHYLFEKAKENENENKNQK